MLRRSRGAGAEAWSVRPTEELNDELSLCYGLPIDVVAKREGLDVVARALGRGDLALAQIAALLLRFPDPPSLAKDAPARGSLELAARLFESGLLKGDWDASKHPRRGEAPNRGWFAAKPDSAELTAPGGIGAKPSASEGASPSYRKVARVFIREAAKAVAKTWSVGAWTNPILRAIDVAATIFEPTEANAGEQRVLDRLRASLDPPKPLDQLQTAPTQNVLGYEVHHIVEQNPANVAKSPQEVEMEKFGQATLDDPSNLVWIPRLKHELVTAYHNSTDYDDAERRLRRRVVSALDYEAQYDAGLEALRKYGVLQ